MRNVARASVAACLMHLTCNAVADGLTADDLAVFCDRATTSSPLAAESLGCYAYLNGFMDGYAIGAVRNTGADNPVAFCPQKAEMSVPVVASIFLSWHARNKSRGLGAIQAMVAVPAALAETFPCSK